MATAVREQLAKARHSAVHLEMRDSYMLDDPEFIAWQLGKRLTGEGQWADAGMEVRHDPELTARGLDPL